MDEIDQNIRDERNCPAGGPGGTCNEDTLVNFLAEIQVINPESVIKLATLKQIEPSCAKVSENLDKIKNYLKGCTPPSQSDLYYQLIKGVETLYTKVCTESPFRISKHKKFKLLHFN